MIEPRLWQGEFLVSPEDLRNGWSPGDAGPIGPLDARGPTVTHWTVPTGVTATDDGKIIIVIHGTEDLREYVDPPAAVEHPLRQSRKMRGALPKPRVYTGEILKPDPPEMDLIKTLTSNCTLAGASVPTRLLWILEPVPFSDMIETG